MSSRERAPERKSSSRGAGKSQNGERGGTAPQVELALTAKPVPGAVSRGDFLETLARLTTSVWVVTANNALGRPLGRTVTSMMSVSAAPPTIMVSIMRDADLAEAIRATQGFSLSMLASSQEEVANAFAGKVSPEERFAHAGSWAAWPSGRPRLLDALAAMDCELSGVVETETHLLFVGTLIDSAHSETDMPLLWGMRDYRRLSIDPYADD